ncbi:methyl-accepting chemotaxis protein [Geobacter pickeringii]|uniref:methyl-accepting chemotaxis protein n=1 Tax=Geobacter pickeringii TaxID=345632 RepID=UPI00068F9CDA|nr:methyl-accepting chemotaxis protein [Geobacter pickeringii]
MKLRNLKVRKKLWMIILSALAGIAVLVAMSLIFLKQDMTREKELKTRHLVETAHSLLGHFQKLAAEGKLSEQDAKNAAIAAIRGMRYQEKEYFWINDMQPTMVMHPYKPELDGKNLSDFKDPKGKKLFVEFVDTVRSKKEGFVYYLWPKPGFSEPVLKVSYVKGFAPWGWIIGSGIYLDDVNAFFWKNAIRFAVAATAIFLLILLTSWIVAKNITRNLADLAGKVNLVANGNLRVHIDDESSDEFGQLARDVNTMARSLNEMINKIFASINHVVSIVDTVKEKAEQTALATREQSLQASQIATAAEEMSQTINDVAGNAVVASETSAEAMKTALEGKERADGAVETIERVHNATAGLSAMIDRLNGSAAEIGDIVTVINDIADQTNLLALNASIEAARAGERGRGFSVVADEVRKLAERTIKATAEISAKIGTVQKESELTRRSMSEASGEVGRATEYIREVGASLRHILDEASTARDQITRIATAVEQQSATAQEMAQNIEKTSASAAAMERMSTEVKDAVYRLSGIDEEIRNSTVGFKTEVSGLLMLELAKTDHRIFVNKLGSCLNGGKKIDVGQIPDHHTCRFGTWYDGEGKTLCGAAPSFRAIDAPHERIHALAREAATACNSGDKARAGKIYEEMEEISGTIVTLLDHIRNECTHPH